MLSGMKIFVEREWAVEYLFHTPFPTNNWLINPDFDLYKRKYVKVYIIPDSVSASTVLTLFCGGCLSSDWNTRTGLLNENSAWPGLELMLIITFK
jgi:hypothetical protein